MRMKGTRFAPDENGTVACPPPQLTIEKIGIVSRDYTCKYENGLRDFSHIFPDVLKFLDEQQCDSVLFSLFSIIPGPSFRRAAYIRGLRHIQSIFYEEFTDGKKRKINRYVVFHRQGDGWREYVLHGAFGSLRDVSESDVRRFAGEEIPNRRVMGNSCILLCGESNGVKYSRLKKAVGDPFHVRSAIPTQANLILNPIHDRMTRREMKLKRKFLSKNGRWVISVWNKGKRDRAGRVRDGDRPAWTVFHNGKEKDLEPTSNDLNVEIGILDLTEG
jgi:hypothetical protein